jgi:hypothetical protein
MGSFGNWLGGAFFGGSMEASWLADANHPETMALLDHNGNLVQLPDPTPPTDPDQSWYKPKANLSNDPLDEVRNSASDHSTFEHVEQRIHGHGANGLNWESWTFTALQKEMEALQPDQLGTLAAAWNHHGDQLKTDSDFFKKSVRSALSENWSGDSASAADAATQQITKTSVFNFTPSSHALAERLTYLSDAFNNIKNNFPADPNHDSGNFNKQKLDQEIHDFDTKYCLDGSGHLRDRSNGRFVSGSDALEWMNELKRATSAYQHAVYLFQNVYTPAVEAVTANFPNLPAPPDMTFGQPPPPVPPGPGGGGGAGAGGGAGGPGPIAAPNMPINPNMPQIPTDPNAGPASPISQSLSELGAMAPELAQSLTQPFQQAASQAGQAMNQAMSAAQRAGNTPALSGASNPHSMPPEGVLGLGVGGGKGALGKIGGAGGGAGTPGLPIGKPAGAPAIAAGGTGAARTVAAASGARLSSAAGSTGAGMPGAGAPAAGHHGAGAPGGPYQPNKALRSKQNGKELIGEPEAVPAVLGEAARADAAKSRPDARKPETT